MSGILKNPKHEIFAQEVAHGRSQQDAAKVAGYRGNNLDSVASRLVRNSHVAARVQEIQTELKDAVLVDARKLHMRWSEMFEADIADIMTETGAFKPIREWPKVWRQMLSGVDVKELFERSKDGGNASWDKIGEVIKLKFVSVKDLGDLIGRHKAVDAFVQQNQKFGEGLEAFAQSIDNAVALGRKRAAQGRQLLEAGKSGEGAR